LFEGLVSYIASDPMRILYLLGGTGGVWYWINQWRDRVRTRVNVIKIEPFIADMTECSSVTCEVENLGARPTSLASSVTLTGYTPKGAYTRYQGEIVGLERDLQPHKPKMVAVDFMVKDIAFLLLQEYRFRLTRGWAKPARICSSSKRTVSPLRFYGQRWLFRALGKYNEPTT